MNVVKFSCLLVPALALGQGGARPVPAAVVPLWPAAKLVAERIAEPEKITSRGANGVLNDAVSNIHNPSLTVFLPPKERATGTGIIICPGGGHRYLAIDHEGYNIASWLNRKGIAAFILKYRLSNEQGTPYKIEDAVEDGRQSVRVVRQHAGEWGLDSARIGIMGFSAGGEITVRTAVGAPAGDEARPDFMIPMYAYVRPGSVTVYSAAPPAFIGLAADDRTVDPEISTRLFNDLRKAGVAAELHVFAKGGHGFGIKASTTGPVANWTARVEEWLKDGGWLAPQSSR